jgi:hypothetical protein
MRKHSHIPTNNIMLRSLIDGPCWHQPPKFFRGHSENNPNAQALIWHMAKIENIVGNLSSMVIFRSAGKSGNYRILFLF